MTKTLLELDRANGKFQALWYTLSTEKKLVFEEEYRLTYLFHEHGLEGMVLRENDIERALGGEKGEDRYEGLLFQAIVRLNKAIERIWHPSEEMLQKKMDLKHLRRIHAWCMPPKSPEAGRYRKEDPHSHVYLHPIEKAKWLGKRLRKYWSTLPECLLDDHPLVMAASLQYHILRIYPFLKYNGRVVRLFCMDIFKRQEYFPIIIDAKRRADYYMALIKGEEQVKQVLIEEFYRTLDWAYEVIENL